MVLATESDINQLVLITCVGPCGLSAVGLWHRLVQVCCFVLVIVACIVLMLALLVACLVLVLVVCLLLVSVWSM